MILSSAQVDINLAALRHNFQQVRALVGDKHPILAMIKANAYGHGLQEVALTLSQANAFGVANLSEAMDLRSVGITQPIVVMSGFNSALELEYCSQYQFIPVVHHVLQVSLLENTHLSKPISIYLKLDSGMTRLGFRSTEYLSVLKRLQTCACVQGPIVLMTHFADADSKNIAFTQLQYQRFVQLTANLSLPKSMANSAAILAHTNTWADWIRPGLILYGVSPFRDSLGQNHHLQPVMTLTSRLIALKTICKDETVGYGCTWRCPHDMDIAIAAIGYGDGYPWHAKHGTPVLLNGQRCPLLGRVSMDMIAIDISALKKVSLGDRVILWGESLPVEEIARCAQTIPYELLCNVTQRVQRHFSNESKHE